MRRRIIDFILAMRRNVPLLLALAIGVAAVLPALLVPGIVATRAAGDSAFLLERVHQMAAAVAGGHIPPRWMPDAAYGLGYPFWNFYAPLPYFLAGVLALLGAGVVGGIKVVTLLVFLVAAAGAYRLAVETWGSRTGGVVAAAAYTLAPYHLVNVYVRGDALGELATYALAPWVLVGVAVLLRQPTPDAVALLALVLAGLVTSHNVSALLFLPLLVAFIAWRLAARLSPFDGRAAQWKTRWARWSRPAGQPGQQQSADAQLAPERAYVPAALRADVSVRRQVVSDARWALPALWATRLMLVVERRLWPLRRRRMVGALAALSTALVLAVLISMWFWAPAVAEADAVQLQENLTGYFSYDGHFLGLDLVDLAPIFDFSAGESCRPCRMGLAQLLVGLMGLLVGLRLRQGRGAVGFWLVVALAATIMMTPLSLPLWRALPLLPYAQFPWRWLSVQALAIAMLSASLARPPAPLLRWLLGLLTLLALGISTVPNLRVVALPVADVTREDITAFEVFSGNIGTTVRGEYLPAAVQPRPMSGPAAVHGRTGDPRAVEGGGFLDGSTLIRNDVARQEWVVDVADDITTTVAFPTLAFPGWSATIDSGVSVPTGHVEGSGWLTAVVPPGRHTVVLTLDRSGVRAVAEGLSLLGLLFVAALFLTYSRRRWWRIAFAAAVTMGAAIGLGRVLPVADAEGPVTLDFARMPYPHYNPGGIAFGDSRLQDVGIRRGVVNAGETMFVNLTWSEPWAGWQVEAALVSPAEAMPLDAPDVRASATEVLGEDQQLVLNVPDDVSTGLYFVRLRVMNEDALVPATTASGEEIGALYVGPVRVRGSAKFRDVPAAPVARMGSFVLHAVATDQDGDLLEVRTYWQTDRAVEQNYKTSVRLLDEDGNVIAQNDKQPSYGFYPTTEWQVGEQVLDRRWLAIPEGTRPGDRYMVEVVLYEELSNEVLGTGRVSGVAIEQVWRGPSARLPPRDPRR